MQQEQTYIAGLYLRLSKDDEKQGESVSCVRRRETTVGPLKSDTLTA